MAIRTFSAQESYRGGIEPRKKLKKVRSVKVANLDRLRLSMRREKSRFNRGVVASSDDATVTSGSSSAAISGTSSPNYMKATTSYSARIGSVQAISGNLRSNSAGSSDNRSSSAKSASKLSKVSVQDFSDPAGVNKIKAEKSLKRVPSLKQSKKMSSKKSMKIRSRYSQFPDVGINSDEILDFSILGDQNNTDIIGGGMEINPECLNVSASRGQDSIGKTGIKQKGILERSRSRRMIRLKSIKSSRTRQRPQSRLSGGATELISYEAEVSNAEPRYMKGTRSQEKRKNSDKGLTRTSSLRPLRILAKIPSLRPKRSKVRKRPQATPLSGKGVDRATCSSTLKRTEVPGEIELHSMGRESEGTSSFHLCPYSYCSIHGHRHHTPSQPLTEFISAKRKLFSNQKGEKSDSKSRGEVEYYTSSIESDRSRQIVSAESYALQEVMNVTTNNALEAEEDGIDFLIKIYAKPRKKWATEDILSKDAEALNGSTYDQISVWDYDGKQAETLSETSEPEVIQRALNDDQQEKFEIFKVCNVDSNDIILQQPLELSDNGSKSVSVLKELEPSTAKEELQNSSKDPYHLASKESAVSPGGDLINIFSDKQKYTSMWQLIHQQLLRGEASMDNVQEVIQADEKESGDGNTSHEMSSLDLEQSRYSNNLKEDVDDQVAVTEKLELHQTAAINLVQEALNAILEHDAESYHQQSNPVQEMAYSSVTEEISTPTASIEENYREDGEVDGGEMSLGSAEKQNKTKQMGNRVLQREPDEKKMSGRQMSNSFSRLKKLFMTAKFIKAMERLKKINPRKPQYLTAEPASENERIYLRHLSMNEKKNTEEWMLDNALRQVISRLDPDQQRRVAQLVEAFETVTPEQEENTNRPYPMISVPTPGSKVAHSVIDEEKNKFVESKQDTSVSDEQVLQKKDDGALVSQKDVPKEKYSREENEYQANIPGENFLQEAGVTNDSDSKFVDGGVGIEDPITTLRDSGVGIEDPINTLRDSSQFPTGDSEVSLAGDMTSIFFNKQQYTGMWNLIYQHAVSNEASVDEKQRLNGYDEENQNDTINCRQITDRDSIPSSFSMDQKEDEENKSAASETPDVEQSAAIKLVKEALSAILKRYEQPPQLQPIPDHLTASDDARDLYISTSTPCTEEDSIERVKNAEKHADIDLEDKMQHVENTRLPPQQQVESDELKAPQRKISNSLSKLKKAIATTRFIKAMERLTKSSPRRSQNLCPDTRSEEERIYLRHRSMDGRKKGEEWMLDYALRQVISKMDPDQQRRVALIVKAFETVHPEQREKSIRRYPTTGEAVGDHVFASSTNEVKECYLESQQKRLKSIEPIPLMQDHSILLPSREALLEKIPQEHHAQQTSLADDTFLQETIEAAISKSTLKLSEESSRLSSRVVTPEEPNIRDEEIGEAFEHSSPFPTANSEVRPDGDMANILLDKQKYTSMWNLIHQHVLSNEATTNGQQEVNEVDEEERGNDANTWQAINDPDSIKSNQLEKSKVDEDNYSAAFDQSAAINLVKEAINAILQCHEQKSNQQSCQEPGRAVDNARELGDTTALHPTKDNSEENRVEKHRNSEPEKKLHEVESTSAPLQKQAESFEAGKDQRKMSKSLSKLKKAIVTAKFIKAMERLRKINPRKPRHLPPEVASEEERVYLRHSSIKGRKNDEEWMLDYALRKVLCSLAPDQQRKVASLVEAFETVHPEQKSIRYRTKSEWDNATGSGSTTDQKRIPKSKYYNTMPNNDTIPPMRHDELDKIGKDATFEKSVQDHSMKFSNQRMESHKISDSDYSNFHSHHQENSKGSPVSDPLRIKTEKKEMGANSIHEAYQHANDFELECKANKNEGILYDKQKNSGMWHLIYQHVKSASVTEAGNRPSERLTGEDQVNRSGTSSDADTDADTDDSDASSVTSELTESDAIKLVKEAINDILNVPQDVEDELTPSNRTTSEGQSIEVEENPKKSLSRGYSKLRKIIICNKFIKAMEKTRNFYPQTGRALNSGSEPRNSHLKNCAVGERKGMDEWMLDNVLQKVIAGLAPVQQKRVSLLVKAFEKVNPDPEERAKRLSYTKTEFPDTSSSEGNTNEIEKAVPSDSSQNSELPGGIHLKLDRSPNSSPEVVTERVLQESCKDGSPGLTGECVLNGQSFNAATSDVISNLSETNRDLTEIDATDAPGVSLEERKNSKDEAGAQVEEKTLLEEQEVENTELTSKFAKKPPQPEDLEDEWNYSAQNSRSLEKPTGLWGLILQHVSVDMLEKNEAPKTIEIDANVQVGSSSTQVSDSKTDDSSQLSSRIKSCRDMGVQTPASFEFEENEAIKLVEEAVEEILLVQDQICDTESITSGTTSEKGVYSENNGEVSDPSLVAKEIAGIATSLPTDATLEEMKTSSEENVTSSYSTLSKVVMCRRFVKAMNKMRKLKALHGQDLSQPPQSQGEGTPSLRQISTRDKASWEEGMLDNALQKVIGNLAPAKKQRVALLVQAFETVGSQPEPTDSWRETSDIGFPNLKMQSSQTPFSLTKITPAPTVQEN